MKLALEWGEKDIVHPLDDGEKKFLSAYGDLDTIKCFDEDPRSLDDKMLQLAAVQSKEFGSRDRVPALQSCPSSSPLVDGGMEIPPSAAYLSYSVLVGTAIRFVSAERRDGDGGSSVIPSYFLAVSGGGSSILPDPRILHSWVSWKESTHEDIRVKSDGKFCWFSRIGV